MRLFTAYLIMVMLLLLRMNSDVRKASGGRGPNLTQRVLLRLLLNGHSLEQFAGGHSAAAPVAAAADPGAETSEDPASVNATKDARKALCQCECSKKGNCSRYSALSDHLNARAACAALVEGLLSSAEASQGGLEALGLRAVPRPGEIAMLLDRLSANVHSITNSGDSRTQGGSPSGGCPCCDLGKEVAVGLYGQPLCQFNHSCFPNAAIVFGGPEGALEIAVIASRSIMCGEEVCISYVSPAAVRHERRKKLYLEYAFTCTCVLCCSCSDRACSSTNVIAHGNSNCSSNRGNSSDNKRNPASPSRSSNTSDSKNSSAKRTDQSCSISFSPAEAFDLQLRAVFCPKAACVSLRGTAEANVLLNLENANQEYLDSFSHREKSPAEDSSGGATSSCVHTVDPRGPEKAARLRRLQLPVLCVYRPREDLWEPVQLRTSDSTTQAPKLGSSPQGNPTIRLVPEELEQLASANGPTPPTSNPPDIRCCGCGDTYELGEILRVVELIRKLEESAQRLCQACSVEKSETIELEGRAVLKLFSAVRAYTHPGNLFLLNIAESLNRYCRGLAALYNGVGLTVSQHLSRAAAALHGRCSTQHADLLVTEGSLLHFLSQADTDEEAIRAWSLWADGDPATAATRSAAGVVDSANTSDATGSETRAKLVLQARECLLQACSIFFSYEGCCAERQKGRVAEGRIADCDRELQALGFPSR
ncbi:zinc finger MYND domain-containing protein, putative [Eimeria acervulina]|uniref:Zinc finger MYND domain-containing protein, putative n=1 Tax=Eimeria acervulina TaxID=5801 RepID=U6GQZ8_EIMAC|nr:zinc finger MYND domain-containing protein, putative [Eimeria acervulina]CDI82605.1 zinc finger MYND domain-containing protein, putative [Eimeria acervulina]